MHQFRVRINIKKWPSQLNSIHLPFKHDPNNINEIHVCSFMFHTKVCISKMKKWIPFCNPNMCNLNLAIVLCNHNVI